MLHELLHNWAHWSSVPKELAEVFSPGHVIGEFSTELVLAGIGVLVGSIVRPIRRHDKKHAEELDALVDERVEQKLRELGLLPDVERDTLKS